MDKIDYKIDPAVDDILDIWRIDLSAGISSNNENSLSRDEIVRAEAYRRRADADQFVAARCGLRQVLGTYLGIRSDEVRFVYNKFGKPELDRKFHRSRFHFNMSRSGTIALIVVSKHSAVGVDVEFIDANFPFLSVAEKYFSPAISARLLRLPPALARSVFYDVWTKIEAYGKGTGAGLAAAVCRNRLTIGTTATTRDTCSRKLTRIGRWSVANIFAGADYAASVASTASVSRIRYFEVLAEASHLERSELAGVIRGRSDRSSSITPAC